MGIGLTYILHFLPALGYNAGMNETQKAVKYGNKRMFGVYLSDSERESLNVIAGRLGVRNERTGLPSLSRLLQLIANGRLTVS